MQQLTRKSLGAMLASVGLATLIGVMGGGIVSADIGQPVFGDEIAPTEAEVTMKERCIWYVDGVASAITLAAQDDPDTDIDESAAVYDGDQYSLSTTLDDYLAWTSGNTTGGGSVDDGPDHDEHAACTFFGEQTGIDVDGVWSGTEFTAEAQNALDDGLPVDDSANMGFDAEGTDPLTMVITEGDCRASGVWTVGPNIVADVALLGSILDLALAGATERPADAALSNDKCNAGVSVTASIPAGKTPQFAGKPYKFTGPTFTTEISIDSDR